ncbi:endonuclease [Bacillus cereus]|uniref:LAGLIDADG family homing endonuclease n=1 Tax=Bacillus cereus TaxID=1396 RepID=UPI000BEE5494|nr:LAGLIDADG family homing endonuclease [Bacillus cereus]PDZ05526.1 endonuclease [Bacillus cereus]PEC56853.1 endonuclease [Bacillus cereus]PFE44943.1 endonuclease [Bacillus cereus]PFN15112.1 endonuclease [Bacillus cereus]PFS81506.1 endonuclease [Bacillus cereus]
MQTERNKKSKCKLSKYEITQLYAEGKSTSEIAILANVSARYIRMVLSDNNVPRRAIGSWKRKYDITEDYFKTWSNNMAYILGFIAADGVIQKENQCVSISQKENYILEDIKQELNTNQPLYQNKKTGVYMLNINSKTIKDDLMNIHGIKPCKSFNIEIPFVPEEYLHHFVRGYFDGDGYVKYETYTVSFVGGSYSFMNSLHQILQNHNLSADLLNQNKHFRVILSGRKSIQLFSKWIYKDKDIYLHRKYEVFQKESLSLEQLHDRKLKQTQTAVKQRKQKFLKDYMKDKCSATACSNLEISESTFKRWLKNDNQFKREYEQINFDKSYYQ